MKRIHMYSIWCFQKNEKNTCNYKKVCYNGCIMYTYVFILPQTELKSRAVRGL